MNYKRILFIIFQIIRYQFLLQNANYDVIIDCVRMFNVERGEKMAVKNENQKIAAQNKKAFHDYFVQDTYEAGIELSGTEVKSIRLRAAK